MRRFELVEGTSSKFWEIELEGTSFEVRWGRIGTSGQSQTKSFPTETKARVEHDKLVKEKTAKGYAEVGGSPVVASEQAPVAEAEAPTTTAKKVAKKAATPSAAASVAAASAAASSSVASSPVPSSPVASSPVATPVASSSVATPVASSSVASSSVASSSAAIPVASSSTSSASTVVLTDPSTWPDSAREHLYPRPAWASAAPVLDRVAIWKKVRERVAKTKAKERESASLDSARARVAEPAPPDALAPIETELGVAALVAGAENAWAESVWVAQGLAWMLDHWAATAGPRAALVTYAALVKAKPPWTAYSDHDPVRRLAEHLAPLPTEERRALAALDPVRDGSFASHRMRLFPELGEADLALRSGAAAKASEFVSVNELASLSGLGTQLSLWQIKTGGRYSSMSTLPVLYTWVASFGDAVLPVLAACLDAQGDAEALREVAEVVAFLATPAALTLLASRAADKNVLSALRDGALAHPDLALAPLVGVALQRGAGAAPCRTILGQLVRNGGPELEPAIAALGEAGRKLVVELREKLVSAEEASEGELPSFVVSPPWLDKKKKAAAGIVAGLAPLPFEESLVWPPGLEAKWARYQAPAWAANQVSSPDYFMMHWGVPRALAERLAERDDAADEAELAEHARARSKSYFTGYGGHLAALPPRLARKLIASFASERWWAEEECFRFFAATEGLAFLDAFLAYARAHVDTGIELLRPYRSPRVAMIAADALHRLKKKPPAARAWLLAHPEVAAIGLVPVAVGPVGKARDTAEHGVRLLASEGHEAVVMEVAARYGEAAKSAMRAVLDFDALDLYPSKIPSVPDFASADALPRLVLSGSGKSLPVSAMRHVLTMLAISKPAEPYAGIARLREITTSASQGELAWELFSSWNVAGAPSKESWAFTAMGLLGNDDCARRITPLIRAWPGESQHQRAVTGLDVLATIGSDVALMHLHGIAQKLKFKGLQEKAREKIDQLAEARGLTADELADRLVPDLGLDDDGSLTLDFGPRSFRVVFDESLKPLVKDGEGKVLGELPKPRKDDDPDKSAASVDVWKALKKDAKTIAQQQVMRLELAMCARRRWSEDVFRRFLVEHPLVRHLVVRLAWGAYDAKGALLGVFRVAEDGTFAPPADDAFELPADALVGLAHTLETPAADEAALAQVFGDYELVQPFRQLGREIHRLTDLEKAKGVVERWKGKKLPTGKVLGLEARGWRRGPPQDGGHIGWMEKTVGEDTFSIDLDPGIAVGELSIFPEQEIRALGVGVEFRWRQGENVRLGEIDPIVASELLRDVEMLFA